jgi:hypothetical protein
MNKKDLFGQLVTEAGYIPPDKVEIVWELASLLFTTKSDAVTTSVSVPENKNVPENTNSEYRKGPKGAYLETEEARECINRYRSEYGISRQQSLSVTLVRQLLQENMISWPVPPPELSDDWYFKWNGKGFKLNKRKAKPVLRIENKQPLSENQPSYIGVGKSASLSEFVDKEG